jgi:hypothetical protein
MDAHYFKGEGLSSGAAPGKHEALSITNPFMQHYPESIKPSGLIMFLQRHPVAWPRDDVTWITGFRGQAMG